MFEWPRERFTTEGKLKDMGERKCEHNEEDEKVGEVETVTSASVSILPHSASLQF